MYAIVKTGGKQYRVVQGEHLLVERLPVDDGATVDLQPLLYVDGADVVDGADLATVTVQAKVVAHERGPKLRIVKFKPKRGYRRRNGHRQDLTRIEITTLEVSGSSRSTTTKAATTQEATTKAATTKAATTQEATTKEATTSDATANATGGSDGS